MFTNNPSCASPTKRDFNIKPEVKRLTDAAVVQFPFFCTKGGAQNQYNVPTNHDVFNTRGHPKIIFCVVLTVGPIQYFPDGGTNP